MWYKSLFYELLVRGEPGIRRINAPQAEECFGQLPAAVRWGIKKLYPYVEPPSVIEQKGFGAPPEMYFDNSLAAARYRP